VTYPTTSYGSPQEPPVCPRHPDRVSYVRCQRCGRPTCPECARTAPVGVQCVDCVAEQAKAQPRTRPAGLGPRGPVATYAIIGLTALSFLLQQVLPYEDWEGRLIFAPSVGHGEPWRLLTVALLHAGILHILMNMWALWVVGPFLEAALGRARFVALYVLSAIGGSVLLTVLAQHDWDLWRTGNVGASGAVFGLFGAVLVVLRRTGGNARSMLVVIGVNLVFGFVVANIAWQAHVGGLLVGTALGAAYAYLPRAYRRWGSVGATALTAVVLAAAASWVYASTELPFL